VLREREGQVLERNMNHNCILRLVLLEILWETG
jgi:hypothetical protein